MINITEMQNEIPLQCLGGCGSGLGFFVVLAVVGSITILGLMIYILFFANGEKSE